MAAAGQFILDGLRYADVIPDDDLSTVVLPEIRVEIDREKPQVEIWLKDLAEGGENNDAAI
jgi:hypothetical protein